MRPEEMTTQNEEEESMPKTSSEEIEHTSTNMEIDTPK